MSGSKSDMEPFAEALCPRGYVVLSIDYRLAPGAPWPAQLDDCREALRYFRAHASDLGIDPARVGVLGVSAGAHLATMLELRDDPNGARPALAVALDGVSDMALADRGQTRFAEIATALLGHPAPWSPEELHDLSTVRFARRDSSVLIVHGASDPLVFVVNADELNDALKKVGADVQYVRIEGKDGLCHGGCWKDPRALDALHDFLAKRLP
jgi:acetyl esterase/lipase